MNWDDDDFDVALPASTAPPAAATPSFTLNDGADWEDEDVIEQAVARVAAPAERRGNKPKHAAKDKAAALAAASQEQAAKLRAIEEEFGPPSADPVEEKWRQEQIRQKQDLLFAGDTFAIDASDVAPAAGAASSGAASPAAPLSDEGIKEQIRSMGMSEMVHLKAAAEALVFRAKNMNAAKSHVADFLTVVIELAGPHMKPGEIDSMRSVLTAEKKKHTDAKKGAAAASKKKPALAKFKAVSTAAKDYGGEYEDLGGEFDDFM